ncbi:predicted protein [Lichtheimia corymbifera JMRC:FSU:9682]|uniref:Peptidase M41 domain-containing protein n=1 Tax=Lichtheimia corymbifera JMRC:FSU:9682 TaxID=1263082 RepID=A0A068SF68_9FUNG|nr:predicted protein [Lichtheimia corymbifera JMRC:FSU:9682]
MLSNVLSSDTKQLIEAEIMLFVMEAEGRAREVLTKHMDELHRLASALIEHETLTQEEIVDAIQNKSIRK